MGWQLLSQSSPRAVKEWKCIWCGEIIPVGTKYKRVNGLSDGDFQSNPFHPECLAACEEELRGIHEDTFMPYENKRGKVTYIRGSLAR